jgi:short-subunit dehydrogenase
VALALITGASSGFGRELARLLAGDGHDVVLVARRRDRLEELARELTAPGRVRAHVVPADLGRPGAAGELVSELGGLGLSEIEVLINNAGFGDNGPLAEADPARTAEMIQLNCATLVALTRALLPGMLARKRGRILNIGSTAGFQPGPYMAVYYASKAFVNSFTEALAFELRGTGVTATVSCPGASETEFADRAGSRKSLLFRAGVAPAARVARQAYRAMLAGRPMVIHGGLNRLVVEAIRFTPRALVRAIAAALNR